jgi:hypothetical protein
VIVHGGFIRSLSILYDFIFRLVFGEFRRLEVAITMYSQDRISSSSAVVVGY